MQVRDTGGSTKVPEICQSRAWIYTKVYEFNTRISATGFSYTLYEFLVLAQQQKNNTVVTFLIPVKNIK